MRVACRYCLSDHKYVCDCGHKHDDHNQMGGCRHSFCKCEGYTQKHRRLPEETTKQYETRLLHSERRRA